jgi:hypothetical protein
MSTSRKDLIIKTAMTALQGTPAGIRYTELINIVKEILPDIPENTIRGIVWNLDAQFPKLIYKPARGLFKYVAFMTEPSSPEPEADVVKREEDKITEADFYQSFADWLVNDLEECTKAIVLGGSKFKDKWGTPDVIGINEAPEKYILKHPTVIVSAEIKLNSDGLITAFGQACSYKLFSHKSYIVVPRSAPEEDVAKLDALSLIFGIGLVLFKSENPDKPEFEIRVRADKHEPDMFYVNKYMKLIEDELFA